MTHLSRKLMIILNSICIILPTVNWALIQCFVNANANVNIYLPKYLPRYICIQAK